LGGLVYLAFFILLLIIIVKTSRKDRSVFSFSLLITVIAYCFVAFFDFPLERIEHQVLLSVVIALAMNEYDSYYEERKFRFTNATFAFLPVIAFSLTVSFYRLKGEYFSREILSIESGKTSSDIEKKYRGARSVFYTIDPRTVPIEYYEAVALYSQGKLNASVEHLQGALKTCPYNLVVLKKLESIYTEMDNRTKAGECRDKISGITPGILTKND